MPHIKVIPSIPNIPDDKLFLVKTERIIKNTPIIRKEAHKLMPR
jgi:hypothetical protein